MKYSEWKKSLNEAIDKFVNKLPTNDEEKQEIINYFNKFKDVKVNWHEKDKNKLLTTLRDIMDTYRSKRQQKYGNLIEGEHYDEIRHDNIKIIFPYTFESLNFFANHRYNGVEGKWCVTGIGYFRKYVHDDTCVLGILTEDGVENKKWLVAYNPYDNYLQEWKDEANSNTTIPTNIEDDEEFKNFLVDLLDENYNLLMNVHEILDNPPNNNIMNFPYTKLPDGEAMYFFYLDGELSGLQYIKEGDDIYGFIEDIGAFRDVEDWEYDVLVDLDKKTGDIKIYSEDDDTLHFTNLLNENNMIDFLTNRMKHFYGDLLKFLNDSYIHGDVIFKDLISQYYVFRMDGNDEISWAEDVEYDWESKVGIYNILYERLDKIADITRLLDEDISKTFEQQIEEGEIDFSLMENEIKEFSKKVSNNVYEKKSDIPKIFRNRLNFYIEEKRPVDDILNLIKDRNPEDYIEAFLKIDLMEYAKPEYEELIEYLSKYPEFCFIYIHKLRSLIFQYSNYKDIYKYILEYKKKYIGDKYLKFDFNKSQNKVAYETLKATNNIEKYRIGLHILAGYDVITEIPVNEIELIRELETMESQKEMNFIKEHFDSVLKVIKSYCEEYNNLYPYAVKFISRAPFINQKKSEEFILNMSDEAFEIVRNKIKVNRDTILAHFRYNIIWNMLKGNFRFDIEKIEKFLKEYGNFKENKNNNMRSLISGLLSTLNKHRNHNDIKFINLVMKLQKEGVIGEEFSVLESMSKNLDDLKILDFDTYVELIMKSESLGYMIKNYTARIVNIIIYLREKNNYLSSKFYDKVKNSLPEDIRNMVEGDGEVDKEIIELKTDEKYAEDMFYKAIKNADIEMLKKVLKYSKINPSARDNLAIQFASENGHLEIVKLLLQDKRVDPSARDNYAISWASYSGHLEVVKLLLQDKRVDPSAKGNWAIRWASQNGHLEVVKLLLQHSKVDPSARDNYAIKWASDNGHHEVVKHLLQHSKVDPSADDNWAIRWASRKGHPEVVKLLLQHPKVQETLSDEEKENYSNYVGLKEYKKTPKQYGADEKIKVSSSELLFIKSDINEIRKHGEEKDWKPVYLDKENSKILKTIFSLEDKKFYEFLITDTNEVLRLYNSDISELLDITVREKEMFAESPHIKINDFIFDLEIEKVKDVFELVNYFRDIFSGKIIKDKYNNTLSLKTKEERNQFLNDLLDNDVFKNYLNKLISNFDISNFYKFFNDYINLQDSETYKSEIGLAIEEAIYLNKEFFDNNIDLSNIKFSLKELNISSYSSFRKSILEKLYNIYLMKNRKCLNENRSKKLKTTFKTVVNNYGDNNFNNWIKL